MNESEKRLRDVLLSIHFAAPSVAREATEALDALLAEHRAEVSAARDAALEAAGKGPKR